MRGELTSFDTQTVAGAMEHTVRHCQDTRRCPAVFCTSSRYDSAPYQAMAERLNRPGAKWDIVLCTDKDFCTIPPEQYGLYMFNPIHPTGAGCAEER